MTVIYEGQVYHVHGPEKCPRRCSVCPDGNHHWLEEFACEPGCDSCSDNECSRWHEASAVHGQDCWYACKHCSAWVECEYVWALEESAEADEAEEWSEANSPCWCGEENPYCDPSVFDQMPCGGLGVLHCECGGDQCVCHNHGEVECPGCEDCEGEGFDPDGYGVEEDFEDEDPADLL